MTGQGRSHSDVAVVGGGAIGLCCAYALARRGLRVTLLERGRCGEAASLGNAGWITPALSTPLPAPGLWRELARWALQREQPLAIRPRLDPAFLRWLLSFWRHSRRAEFEAGARAMLALAAHTLASFSALRAEGAEFETHETGLTFVALSDRELEKYERAFADLVPLGYDGQVVKLTGAEARTLEPALTSRTAGALHAVGERHVRPESFTGALRDACQRAGVQVREHTEALRLEVHARRVCVHTREGRLAPDVVVAAAGVWTGPLLRSLSIRLPIESAKGYSLTVAGPPPVGRALYLSEARLGISPFDGATRVAGLLELTGIDTSLDPRRKESLSVATSRYLPGWPHARPASFWSGLRPLTPDGLPVIGRCAGYENLYTATGHGMLGITLAPVTGSAIAALVLGEASSVELAAFSPDRFAQHNVGGDRSRRLPSELTDLAPHASEATERSE